MHSSYKFCLLTLRGTSLPATTTTYGFFLEDAQRSRDTANTFLMSAEELAVVNPDTRQPPVCRSRSDFVLLLRIQSSGIALGATYPAWVGLTSVSTSESWIDSSEPVDVEAVPMYESKLIHQFDHRFATYDGTTADQRRRGVPRSVDNSERDASLTVFTRFLIPRTIAASHLERKTPFHSAIVGYRDVARSTDERTFISSVVPFSGLMQPLNGLTADTAHNALQIVGFSNSFVFDFAARLKTPGIHVNVTIANQLPCAPACNPQLASDDRFFVTRVLELTYTAWDLEAFAMDCGYDGPPFRWDEERRFLLRCELDAAYFHLYLGSPSEWGSDSPKLREMFPTPRDAVDYIMETFPIVKRKDIKRTEVKDAQGEVTNEGTYITKDTILAIYDEMQQAIDSGEPYQTHVDPPPGPPTDADGNFIPMDQWNKIDWSEHAHLPREEAILKE